MNLRNSSILHSFPRFTAKWTAAIIITLYVCSIQANELSRELLSLEQKNGSLHIQLSDTKLTIRAINQGTVEVFYEPENTKQLPSFALPKNVLTYTSGSLSQTDNAYHYTLPALSVNIQKSPFKLSFSNAQGALTSEEIGLFNYEALRGFRFTLSDGEQIMGGGQRVLGMDRRGHRMPLYNKAHYGYTTESNQMYFGLAAVMSNKGYVIAFDNSANGYLDIGHTEVDVLQFEAEAGRTAYIFSAGNTSYELIENFVSATGKQPLPPRWALGNYASRFGYKSQQQVLDTIAQYEEKDFPVDAVVLDLYWFGPTIKGHMGNLNWDLKNWPEPEKMIKTLADKGVKTIMITEPFVLSNSTQWQSAVDNKALVKSLAGKPRRFDFYFGNTGLVDVFDTQAQDWFWQYYQKLNEQGAAGWWGDLGEPEVHPADSLHNLDGVVATGDEVHNVYGHKWAEMVYTRQANARPNERPFVMMRSGFIGSQRFGMVPWTGDVDRSWGGLQSQVELALQMGLFGLAYTHSDLGGFAGGELFDAELYTRWLQYGVFQAVYRPHAQDHIPPEPVFHDDLTQNIVREFVKLRYRLLPYNYSLSMQNSLHGLPMMRPLFMDFPEQAISRTDAYMWGDAFLVAPIINQGKQQIEVTLPKGIWFDFWDDQIYLGDQKQIIRAPLNELPVLVKAGSFVPMASDMRNTSDYTSDKLKVHFYAHKQVKESNYAMFDDDGKNPLSIQNNEYQTLEFNATWNKADTLLKLNINVKGSYASAPTTRDVVFSLHNIEQKPTSIKVDGRLVKWAETNKQLNQNQAIYDAELKTLTLPCRLLNKLEIVISE